MIENLVKKGIGTGDTFAIIGAVDGKRYDMKVEAVSLTYWHANGQKIIGTNIVARNLDTGIKAVWSLDSLIEKKARYTN